MKKTIRSLLCLSLCVFSAAFAEDTDSLDSIRDQTQDFYRNGSGSDNATFNTIGRSMIAWGLGLSVAIAILASAIKQSDAPTTTTTTQ